MSSERPRDLRVYPWTRASTRVQSLRMRELETGRVSARGARAWLWAVVRSRCPRGFRFAPSRMRSRWPTSP
eukprot:6173240-Pleurochrysis_carterae.AAC.12